MSLKKIEALIAIKETSHEIWHTCRVDIQFKILLNLLQFQVLFKKKYHSDLWGPIPTLSSKKFK